MAEKMKLTPEQLAKLLALASARTGQSPEKLLELLSSGDISGAAAMFGEDGRKAQELFASGRLEELLGIPAVGELLAQVLR